MMGCAVGTALPFNQSSEGIVLWTYCANMDTEHPPPLAAHSSPAIDFLSKKPAGPAYVLFPHCITSPCPGYLVWELDIYFL